jgi:hypothetical protein
VVGRRGGAPVNISRAFSKTCLQALQGLVGVMRPFRIMVHTVAHRFYEAHVMGG